MSASAHKILDAASRLGLDIELREFPAGTRAALDAARAIGVDAGQIVKEM